MKLFTKYSRLNLAVMSLVFVISGLIYYLLISNMLIAELDEALGEYEVRMEKYLSINGALPVFENIEEVLVSYHKINKAQDKVYSTVKLYDAEEHAYGVFRQLLFTQKVKGQLYQVKICIPIEGTKMLTNVIAFTTLGMLLLVIVSSLIFNYWILGRLWRPFYTAMSVLRTYKLGSNVVPKLPVTEIEEFSFMNASLTKLMSSIGEDYNVLKEFTENAAHEIQTPLAIIRSKLDVMIQAENLSESQSMEISSIYTGIRRLSKLNHSLLLLAKIENDQFSGIEKIDMKEKLQEKFSQFHELWEGKALQVVVDLNDSTLEANHDLVDVLLNNLLSNAGNHNYDRGDLKIALHADVLEITNSGNGAKLEEAALFTRFYKENQHSSSNGLGLSIIKQICDRSGIDVHYRFTDGYHSFILTWITP
ncbi:sensor histidine kinase [Pedobacter gandavensis]|uniref:histidine kinase n=1 Tax=Pedobacter gandavensis TaxID=2679963 RepID=A0ABR6ESL4_9SPHI|nr:HAMP domain-containing sensor histidine kinase [Pedobacter gandavensis]MBB2148251.1 hypothetical protein [Pedobacter gandavensis]